VIPCAVYTRKSSEEGLEQGFNSLDAQREACEAFILSQKTQGWRNVACYDDGGFSGGNVERPGLKQLMAAIKLGQVKVVVVYKVDRLTRSLADFAKLVELFDGHGVSFVSVTQQFNTTSSMGRLTLNVLLSFAQFEREVTGERIRDKIAASKRKGMWMGGFAPLGYVPHERKLKVDPPRAERVQEIFRLYLKLGSVRLLKVKLDAMGWKTPEREGKRPGGGKAFTRGHLYRLLANPIYIGQIGHKGQVHPGQHEAIVEQAAWRETQKLLAANAQTYSDRSTAADPAPLAGLLFDAQGRKFASTHANKKGRRYRYYMCPQDGDEKALWMPAPEIEAVTIGLLRRFLTDETQLLQSMPGCSAQEAQATIARAAAAAQALGGSGAEQIKVVSDLVTRIVVKADAVALEICLRSDHAKATEERHNIEVPATLKRAGAGRKLVVAGLDENRPSGADARLVSLLGKAKRWFKQLSSEDGSSVRAIAEENGMARAEAINVIYLAFLAPDLVERIAQGRQPVGLGTKRLLAMAPLPLDWEEQRRVFDAG
jgi:DNA invertase Pin-like site-specific DNA recombinase